MSDKKTILYIDDEELNTELFELNFEDDFNVLTGESGKDGLKILETNTQIDVVISDMKMPEMNGVEFIQKAKEKFADKEYYLLSGFELNEEIQQAIQSNLIKQYFKKPLDITEITSSISKA